MFNFLKFVLKTVFGTVLVVVTLIVIAVGLASIKDANDVKHDQKENHTQFTYNP